MLAVIDHLQGGEMEFVALTPSEGPLKAELESRKIATVPFDVRDSHGQRRPREVVQAELRHKLTATASDLVHANSLSMGRLTGAIAEDLPMPSVSHLRDIIKLTRKAIADLNGNTRLVAVSDATRAFHVSQGMRAERVLTITNGVDCERFQPRPADALLRRELGLSPKDFLVLTVGQMGLRKGQDVLADAAGRLASLLPRAHYLLAGQRCSDKRESREFEERVIARLQCIGNGKHLQLLGYREDMPRLMNAADVLVHPAHQEPLGRVLLEAAASGLPIIATNVGGTAEILRDGESALLVPPANPELLATAIHRLAGDAELRSQLAANARKRMLANFPIATAAGDLLGLWLDVLSRAP
jgi:glycosyltransferase involved in cell wall biosynthesis